MSIDRPGRISQDPDELFDIVPEDEPAVTPVTEVAVDAVPETSTGQLEEPSQKLDIVDEGGIETSVELYEPEKPSRLTLELPGQSYELSTEGWEHGKMMEVTPLVGAGLRNIIPTKAVSFTTERVVEVYQGPIQKKVKERRIRIALVLRVQYPSHNPTVDFTVELEAEDGVENVE